MGIYYKGRGYYSYLRKINRINKTKALLDLGVSNQEIKRIIGISQKTLDYYYNYISELDKKQKNPISEELFFRIVLSIFAFLFFILLYAFLSG